MAQFVPRQAFHVPSSIPKTYFLGHHHAGANKIKTILPTISIILECRDFRLPLSTQNPMLEQAVAGRERLLVYTKSDLGADSTTVRERLTKIYGDRALFWDKSKPSTTWKLLGRLKKAAEAYDCLTGIRVLVVGMPNVGKSTLLNSLRKAGISGRTTKVAKTGDQAGVTRKVGTAVRVVPPQESGGVGGGVFVLDTPGIFQPYVEDGETMLKVALAHGIKKGLVHDEILADYLLYRMNLWGPSIYAKYSIPTNDINVFLSAVAEKEGKLKAGGRPNLQEAAARILSLWREGKLCRYVLDDLTEADISLHQKTVAEARPSISQARKKQKKKGAEI